MPKPKNSSKRFKPANHLRSPLRLANFMLIFAIIGVLFLAFSGASQIPGMYGSVEKNQADSINYARSGSARASLQHIECLNSVAEDWTRSMVARNSLSHNPNGLNQVIAKCGSDWTFYGENVGKIDISPNVLTASNALFGAFMGSNSHRANILDARAKKVGVGAYVTSSNVLYVTQVFAACSSCGGNWGINASLPADPVEASVWHNWENLGGVSQTGSAPAAASWASRRLDVFIRGTDNKLKHKYFNGSWSGWFDLGGNLASSPAAVSWGSGRIDVFAKSANNTLLHKWYSGGWSGWEDLGGSITSAPAVSSWGSGRLDVFARGDTGTLKHKYFNGSWSGWFDLGGTIDDAPSAVSWGTGRIDVFAKSSSNGLQHKWFSNGWSGWENLGGTLTSAPTASSMKSGRLDVFVRGANNSLYQKYFNGSWSGLNLLDSRSITSAPAALSWADRRIDIFARGSNGELLHKWFGP